MADLQSNGETAVAPGAGNLVGILCVVAAVVAFTSQDMAFFAGLASLPLGEATAIFFVAPVA